MPTQGLGAAKVPWTMVPCALVVAAPSRAPPAKRRLALEVACGHDLGSPLGALFVDRGDYRTHENPCLGPRASCPADRLPRLAHRFVSYRAPRKPAYLDLCNMIGGRSVCQFALDSGATFAIRPYAVRPAMKKGRPATGDPSISNKKLVLDVVAERAFDVALLLLHLAFNFLIAAFGARVGIARFLLHIANRVVGRAFDLVGEFAHLVSPHLWLH